MAVHFVLERFSIALHKYVRESLEPAEAVACRVSVHLSELSSVTTNDTPLRRPPVCLFGSLIEPESSGSIKRSNTARPNRDIAGKCLELAPTIKALVVDALGGTAKIGRSGAMPTLAWACAVSAGVPQEAQIFRLLACPRERGHGTGRVP
jgi:hypothetical protein